jgi:hypothetical protein
MASERRSLIDHVIIASHRLDEATRRWQALGFNLSDPGGHPTRGTANRCIPFPNGYLELLAPAGPQCREEFLLQALAEREGATSIALTMHDTATVHACLAGIVPGLEAPVTGGRDIFTPTGPVGIAFDVQRVPSDALWPGRFFFCRHHHPERVFETERFAHPNGARHLHSVVHAVPGLPTRWPAALETLGFRQIAEDGQTLRIDCDGVELILATPAALSSLIPAGLLAQAPARPAPVLISLEADGEERWIGADQAGGVVLHFRARR